MKLALDEVWPAEPGSVPRARAAVVAYARAGGASADALEDIRLAVSEAVTNVVLHAYPAGDPGPMLIRARIEQRRLVVHVTDHGAGLRPRPDSPGLGLGLPLIAAVTESLSLTSGESEPSSVAMTFDLDTARDAVA